LFRKRNSWYSILIENLPL